MQILQLRKEDLKSAFEVLKELRISIKYEEFIDIVNLMQKKHDYIMFGLWDESQIQTYAGVTIATNLYWKKHLYIHELVTKEKMRGNNYGREMVRFLEDYAKMHKCENIVLTSRVQHENAHKFYKREGFDVPGYVFLKSNL